MAIGELEVAGSCDQGVDLDDIEDIFTSLDATPKERAANRTGVVSRSHRKKKDLVVKTDRHLEESPPAAVGPPPICESVIPGTQTVYVRTWGCTHNNSDSEYMAGQLAAYGYNVTEEAEEADLWLLNSCTVKNPAEDGFKNAIAKARGAGRHVVVAGCVPQGQQKADYLKHISVVGVQQIDRVVEVVEETLKGHTVRLFNQKKKEGKKIGGAALNLPKIRKNPLIEIIAINTGCLNQCTYCKTKHARGELGSYPPEEIVERAKQSFEEGCVEIWLTSEDTGAYGKDIGVTLPELLWRLIEVIPEGGKMRVGMTNPPYIQEYLQEMSEILNHDRVYSFLHIPVQSGSNKVLHDMKREYTVEDFRHTVDFLKARVPELTVATDLICGFPYETDEDFDESCQLVKDYQFPSLFINQFFPRPGTPAAKMKRVPTDEVKLRTKKVSEIFKSYLPYGHKMSRREKVLITEDAKDKIHFVGHNNSYDQVLVKCDEGLMGKMVEVEIYECGKHFMKGRLVEDGKVISATDNRPLKKGVVSGVCKQTADSGARRQRTSDDSTHSTNQIREAGIIASASSSADGGGTKTDDVTSARRDGLSDWRQMSGFNLLVSVGLVVFLTAIALDLCRIVFTVFREGRQGPS